MTNHGRAPRFVFSASTLLFGLGALLAACGTGVDSGSDASPDAPVAEGAVDAAPRPDGASSDTISPDTISPDANGPDTSAADANSPDASATDAAPEATVDAAEPDASEPDAAPDAGLDSALEAGPDAGPDAGPEAGPEAGIDAGPEATPDACTATDPLDDNGVDSNCDGAEGVVTRSIYVAQGGAMGATGSPTDPVPTLQEALVLAQSNATRRAVLVAAGSVPYATQGLGELLALGATVSGGYEPTVRWSRPQGAATPVTATSLAPAGASASNVRVLGGANAGLLFVQLTALAGTASAPNSVALSLESTSGFTLDHSRLIAGVGQAGANGTSPSASTVAGGRGNSPTPSSSGTSCNAGSAVRALPAAALSCGTANQPQGGFGGYGPRSSSNNGAGGNATSGALGGAYSDVGTHNPGAPGAMGATGAGGVVGASAPSFSSASVIALSAGGGGGSGAAGGAGGGGGSYSDSAGEQVLAGAGGNGGCGGSGGGGGNGGGYSVALLLSGPNAPVLARTELVRAQAGNGGRGGNGGAGAAGGAGGAGQTCHNTDGPTETGPSGGAGAMGGPGGGGAGGNAGGSFGLLTFGLSLTLPTTVTFTSRASGFASGGASGNPGGASGLDGRGSNSAAF